jgi:predicted hotdog family 3-hydroxylacyl-ACP dehydratase
MKNKYKEGEIVYASSNPMLPLVVIAYTDDLYHCRVQADPTRQGLVYSESDLAAFSTVETAPDTTDNPGQRP